MAALWAEVSGVVAVAGAPAVVVAGSVGDGAAAALPWGAVVAGPEVAGGVMAEGSRTSFALVQEARANATSNDTVVTCDRLICLLTPWRRTPPIMDSLYDQVEIMAGQRLRLGFGGQVGEAKGHCRSGLGIQYDHVGEQRHVRRDRLGVALVEHR